MKRLRFTVVGEHPLLHEVRRHLIVDKFMQLVDTTDPTDLIILGAELPADELRSSLSKLFISLDKLCTDVPILVLSSHRVYSDRDDQLRVSENKPMSEDRASVITSVLDDKTPNTLFTLTAEHLVLRLFNRALVLRVFDVYGPGLPGPLEHMLTCALNKEPIQIETPGYQVRTYLHIEDFISAFDRVLIKLFKGVRGIYNLGSSEEISFKRLADSIWQLTNPGVADVPVKLITPKGRSVWWIVPDITRIQALLNWKPQITIRRGLWTLVSEGQQNGHHEQAVSVASR